MTIKCIVCNFSKFDVVWNDKIRNSSKGFTKSKKIILKCNNCELIFLKNRKKNLENSSVARKIYNKSNSIEEFIRFHKPREIKKIKFLSNYLNLKNKDILELNCGAGTILSNYKKICKSTTGVDDHKYKNYLNKVGHEHYSSINNVLKKKLKYDYIFSMSELEHKFDPKKYLLKINKLMKKNSKLVLRVPNFENIYMYLLGKYFLRFDYRTSHNFYFSIKNLELLFKKTNFKIRKKLGFNEYSANHLIEYLKTKKRVYHKPNKFFSEKESLFIVKNIEKMLISTSLIYLLEKK